MTTERACSGYGFLGSGLRWFWACKPNATDRATRTMRFMGSSREPWASVGHGLSHFTIPNPDGISRGCLVSNFDTINRNVIFQTLCENDDRSIGETNVRAAQ